MQIKIDSLHAEESIEKVEVDLTEYTQQEAIFRLLIYD